MSIKHCHTLKTCPQRWKSHYLLWVILNESSIRVFSPKRMRGRPCWMTSSFLCICTLSWLVLLTPLWHWVQSVGLRARGPSLLQRKARGGSHLSSAQQPNKPLLYWEPKRWMGPLHHGCMGAQWRLCTAGLFDSQLSLHPASLWLPLGQCRVLLTHWHCCHCGSMLIDWIFMLDDSKFFCFVIWGCVTCSDRTSICSQ